MKKLLTLALILVLAIGCLLSLTACQTADYTIGICQLMPHEALDAATQGFIDALTEKMNQAGKTVKFDNQNAGGDATYCTTIVNKFVSGNYDLILANATASLQAAATATKTIPVLGTSITNYADALSVENYNGIVGGNVSGTSDLGPINLHAQMIKDLFPTATKVGILYCSNEPNSVYQANVMKEELAKLSITDVENYTFSDSNDIQSVTTLACDDDCDVLYVPTDNMAATYATTIGAVCRAKNMPVIAAEEGTCKGCGVATLTIDYYELGKITGEMAAQILLEGANISTMPVAFCEQTTYKYNKEIADELGLTLPSNYQQIVTE